MSRLFSGTPLDRPPLCDRCGKAPADCRCMPLPPKKKPQPAGVRVPSPSSYKLTPENSTPPADQLIKIQLQKRKGNRFATVLTGLDHPANDLPKLCNLLKTSLGTGGSIQNRTIEIQGDHKEKILALLQQQNLKARLI